MIFPRVYVSKLGTFTNIFWDILENFGKNTWYKRIENYLYYGIKLKLHNRNSVVFITRFINYWDFTVVYNENWIKIWLGMDI